MKKVIKGLASAKLTIFLFFTLAATSVFGTVVAQGLPQEHYERLYGPVVMFLIQVFDITDMYHSWWFTLLLILLAVNIATCTVRTLPGTIRQALRRDRGGDEAVFRACPIRYEMDVLDDKKEVAALENELRALAGKLVGRPVVKDKEGVRSLYAERGAYTRFGVVFVHISVLIILAGGLVGSMSGFTGQMTIVEGETASAASVFPDNREHPLPFSVRCDRFVVQFYDNGMPKEYRSDITIIDEGTSMASESVRVNHPVTYQGYKLCQATYGIADASDFRVAVTDTKSGDKARITVGLMKKAPLPGSDASFAVAKFVPDFQGQGPAVLGVILAPGMAHDIFWIPAQGRRSMGTERGDFVFRLENFTTRYYTGLQISKNPGMPLVWIGFGLIVVGFILVLFGSHRRLWMQISLTGKGRWHVQIAAKTDRKGDGNFERAIERHLQKLTE